MPAILVALAGCTPPALTLEGPAGPLAGPFSVTLAGAPSAELIVDGAPIGPVPEGPVELDPREWPDGAHRIEVVAGWPWARGRASLDVHTDHTGPALALSAQPVSQGHTLTVFVRSDEPLVEPSVRVLERDRPLFEVQPGVWRALIGVPIRADAGPTQITASARDALGNEGTASAEIVVSPVDWPVTGRLPLSRKAASVEPEAVTRMRAERDAVYATRTPVAAWSGPWRIPLVGTHTSTFGTSREYPDGTRSHHDAEDIALRRGAPVRAPAPGRVALAHAQEVHGNAVLIDHGHGVISLYSHLDGFAVTIGQEVQTGDLLGTVGSTGRSTGPHLHWGVVVDGVPVDPMAWLDP